MNEALNEAIREAYAVAPADVAVIESIELSHSSINESIYMVQSRLPMIMTLETGATVEFEPVPFRFTLPAAGENGRQELRIAIDNVDRRISDFIEQVKSHVAPVKLVYRPYLSNDLSQPQMNPPLVLSLQQISVSALEVTGRATFADILNRKFPADFYTRNRFPGLGG